MVTSVSSALQTLQTQLNTLRKNPIARRLLIGSATASSIAIALYKFSSSALQSVKEADDNKEKKDPSPTVRRKDTPPTQPKQKPTRPLRKKNDRDSSTNLRAKVKRVLSGSRSEITNIGAICKQVTEELGKDNIATTDQALLRDALGAVAGLKSVDKTSDRAADLIKLYNVILPVVKKSYLAITCLPRKENNEINLTHVQGEKEKIEKAVRKANLEKYLTK